ncbi:MAG: hypothetical protein H6Q77_106 [Gemmatimonadetes bacterium]|jgi:hypothetical protein|nr:hypothetical protein [Gemmatimonadota bacterium]
MTHLTMEQLLELREPGIEPGTAAQREHLEHCEACRLELDRLEQRAARLRALPTLRPARDQWPRVAARVNTVRRQRRIRWATAGAMALAASLALALLVKRPLPAAPATSSEQELSSLMQRSRALEAAIGAYDPDARVLDGRTSRVASDLEDRIADVDRRLERTELAAPPGTGGPDVMQLWQERVGLLDALVDVHVTRASNVGL